MRRPGFVVAFAVLTGMLCTDTALAQSTTGWPVYGGDSGNTRYGKLDQITTKNVQRLKVAWVLQLGTLEAQESTPLVIGDTLYVTSSSGPKHVFAVEAKTGTVRWRYSPEIPADVQQTTCCGLDNRGVAYAKGKIFVTRLDGYLVALDARTGKELWKSQVVDYTQGAAITSPPTAVKNLVVTGFAGGEYGVRGYISAFDQDTGKEVWRLYTVPATGEPGSETWKGDSWKFGGGAAWYVGSYDPQLNLLYYGTSNPAPWAAVVRGPDSSAYGDFTNLFTASTLAIDPDSGKIVWHYQSTPYDAWDYDGVNELVLADVVVGGQTTPVLFKADRNGFFYVLNRKTGKLISAEPYVFVNWATGVDKASGRPIEIPEKRPRLDTWARDICPNLFGGKNWEPMAYSPQTRLVYIPTFNLCMDLAGRTAEYKRGMFYLGSEWDLAKVGPGGHMSEAIAWDPIKNVKVWGNKEELPFMGGMLPTAGGLVFHGNIQGWFKALDASTGKLLWQFNTGSGISAGPVTYELDGKQYVAVVSGRLVTPPSFLGHIGEKIFASSPPGGALFVFELPAP
ncbi:MAG: PQQ-dependent dehydrogenase, methanol/ethanol family [Candidatus Rokuibacteriota bacterium]|nr:MAG: PQQ-dependent dehydrogenase, methanol/ethanol family [Candidatus Rokubacteria bacterium]PYN70839.1 MAG: PQQ-dependent dehydrogenase, methanol/ethanol family [Candidatus Rokubacteria bacterium]